MLTAQFRLTSAGNAALSTEKFKLGDINENYLNCTNAQANITITQAVQNIPVTGITLDKSVLSLEIGETALLTATISPSNATNKLMSWTSSNNSVATVTNGRITAVSLGTATITATTVDGAKTATCRVTVTECDSHSYGEWQTRTPASCNTAGIEFRKCTVCAHEETRAIPATGNHSYGEWVIEAPATPEHDGTKSAACTECGHKKYENFPYGGEVTDILYGDVNNDGTVNRNDLLRLAKYLSGWDVEINESASNVAAEDDVVNRRDLLRLAKYFSGFNVQLGK